MNGGMIEPAQIILAVGVAICFSACGLALLVAAWKDKKK